MRKKKPRRARNNRDVRAIRRAREETRLAEESVALLDPMIRSWDVAWDAEVYAPPTSANCRSALVVCPPDPVPPPASVGQRRAFERRR